MRGKEMRTQTQAFVRQLLRDTKLTVVAGLLFGGMLSAVALLVFVFKGSWPFQHLEISPLRAIITYLLVGGLAGLLIGLVLPLTRWMLGAAVVAFVATFAIWFVVGRWTNPGDPLLETVKTSLVLGAAFGLPMGVGFWYQGRRYHRTGTWS
jgi:riboflavin transporter FmnP